MLSFTLRRSALLRPSGSVSTIRYSTTHVSEATKEAIKGGNPTNELLPAAEAAHQNSGLTTSHPSPDIISAEVLSDAPPALQLRSVRIYKPTKTTMQSGKAGTDHWRIDWDILQGSARWENKLMGWASSFADPSPYSRNVNVCREGTTMKFRTKDDAIHFAEKQGWTYQVEAVNQPKIPPKAYAENFVHVPGKLRIHRTK